MIHWERGEWSIVPSGPLSESLRALLSDGRVFSSWEAEEVTTAE